jgi:hypothetical protein
MNTVNASTGFSGFQRHLGRSPRIIPPLIPAELATDPTTTSTTATDVMNQLTNDIAKACDNLLLAKITQAHHAQSSSGPKTVYKSEDMVMLLTANH